jgi:hypothetical protein
MRVYTLVSALLTDGGPRDGGLRHSCPSILGPIGERIIG